MGFNNTRRAIPFLLLSIREVAFSFLLRFLSDSYYAKPLNEKPDLAEVLTFCKLIDC